MKNILKILLLSVALVTCFIVACKEPEPPKITFDDSGLKLEDEMLIPLEFKEVNVSPTIQPIVQLTFSKTLRFESISKDSISITEKKTNTKIIDFEVKKAGNPKSFLIAIKIDLTENRDYSLEVSGIEDNYKNRIKVKTNFWTGTFAPILDFEPQPGSKHYIDQGCFIQFNLDLTLDKATVTTENIYIQKLGAEDKLTLKDFVLSDSNKLSFNIASLPVVASGLLNYELKVTENVHKTDGTPLNPFSIVFTPANREIIKEFTMSSDFKSVTLRIDIEAPYTDGAIVADKFYFEKVSNNEKIAVKDFVYDAETGKITLAPSSTLAFATDYRFIVNNITFRNGTSYIGFNKEFKTLNGLQEYQLGANFGDFAMRQETFGDAPDSNYEYIFVDDFDKAFTNDIQTHDNNGAKFHHTKSPDPAKWDVITDFRDNGWYKAEQAYIENGKLVIKAESKSGSFNKRPADRNENYTRISGRIQSKQKFGFLYGKVYAKFKLAKGASWPALWFITNIEKYKDEIDMVEYYPHKDSRDWQAVAHGGTDWGAGHWGGGNNLTTHVGPSGTNLFDYNVQTCMTWENYDNAGSSTINIDATLFNPSNNTKVGDYKVWNNADMGRRYLRSMYPIIEIQTRGYGLGDENGNPNSTNSDRTWKNNNPGTPKLFEVDYIKIAQRKDKRFATVIDEFFTMDNFAKTPGIRKAHFNYPNVEGINYGRFEYGGQPVYETDLLVVDEKYKNQPQSIVYRAKNLRGVSLLAYFENSSGMGKNTNTNFSRDTGLPNKNISEYANDPSLDFKIQVAATSNGPWVDMPFDARWNGNDNNSSDVCAAKIYEKIDVGERKYNYVKILFPLVGDNWNKILLSKVVLTRYEGTAYNNYQIEGEE